MSKHSIEITAFFRNLSSQGEGKQNKKSLVLNILPDTFELPQRSEYDIRHIPYTNSQFLFYRYSVPPVLEFSVKVVAGIDDEWVARTSTKKSDNAFENLQQLNRELSSFVLPENGALPETAPPPKSILRVGSMVKASGVFQYLNSTFKGPYDEEGRPSEMVINAGLLPSQFYDPRAQKNPTGFVMDSTSDINKADGFYSDEVQNEDGSTTQEISAENDISSRLTASPAGNNVDDAANQKFTIIYGE